MKENGTLANSWFLEQKVGAGIMRWAVARSLVRVVVVRIVLCKIRTVLGRELVDRSNQLVHTKWFGNIFVLFTRIIGKKSR